MQDHRPASGTEASRVWEIADRLTVGGPPADRKAVIDAFAAEGGSASIAVMHYKAWRRHSPAARLHVLPAEPGTTGPVTLHIKRDGRLLIPADLRAAMLVDGETAVTARVENGELRVVSGAVGGKQA